MSDNIKILKNYLLYILTGILICMVGISNVFAYDTSQYYVVADVSSKLQQLVSTSYGSSPFNNPINSGYAFGDVLEVSHIVNNYSFQANKVYQLEVHLGHQKFTSSNVYSVVGLNGENCLISYDNSIMNNDSYPRWAFQCPHATNTITITITNSSGSYLWSGTNVFDWVSATLWASDTISFENSDADNIINNQNQNTQDIINNQNQNTQNIIDNQNAIAEQQEKQQEVCNVIDKGSITQQNKKLNSTGAIEASSAYGLTDYIKLGKSLTRVYGAGGTSAYFCWYDSSKTLLSCQTLSSFNSSTVSVPADAVYFRTSIETSANRPQFKVCYDGNQAISNSLTDDSAINIDSLGNTAGWLPPGPIDSIINLPLNLLNNLMTALNRTCAPINIPLPYVNKNLPIPCISTIFNQITGLPSFWNWVGVITSVVILYRYLIALYKYYDDLTTLKANFISDFGGAP